MLVFNVIKCVNFLKIYVNNIKININLKLFISFENVKLYTYLNKNMQFQIELFHWIQLTTFN